MTDHDIVLLTLILVCSMALVFAVIFAQLEGRIRRIERRELSTIVPRLPVRRYGGGRIGIVETPGNILGRERPAPPAPMKPTGSMTYSVEKGANALPGDMRLADGIKAARKAATGSDEPPAPKTGFA
jgi:hypothetical protein